MALADAVLVGDFSMHLNDMREQQLLTQGRREWLEVRLVDR
jgi:hypothetical protein